MANYVVDPAVLKPFVPSGTELDFIDKKTYLSIIGFRSIRTRVLGFTFPFHKDFEEVNLRFYVRRKIKNSWLRGMVFVSELVLKCAIAFPSSARHGLMWWQIDPSWIVISVMRRLGIATSVKIAPPPSSHDHKCT